MVNSVPSKSDMINQIRTAPAILNVMIDSWYIAMHTALCS